VVAPVLQLAGVVRPVVEAPWLNVAGIVLAVCLRRTLRARPRAVSV
jgi:hypothetical protein